MEHNWNIGIIFDGYYEGFVKPMLILAMIILTVYVVGLTIENIDKKREKKEKDKLK